MAVVICAYNSASRLPDTVAHLDRQESPSQGWEVILVDNNSTDETREVALRSWRREDVELRIVAEPRPGLSHARERGIASSSSEFICFVDDDNHLCPNYLATAEELLAQHPQAAVLGGQGKPVIAGGAPPWMWQGWQSHAVGPQGTAEGLVSPERGFVYGAGMVIRRKAWEQLKVAGFSSLLLDREGGSLGSGGDVEICLALRLLGWEVMYSPRLEFGHLMPESRLTWDYCRRLFRAYGEANATLELYRPWLVTGGRAALRRTAPGVLAHLLLEMRRLGRRLARPVASNPGSVSALQQCEAEGKRQAIAKMLKTGAALSANRRLKRLAAARPK